MTLVWIWQKQKQQKKKDKLDFIKIENLCFQGCYEENEQITHRIRVMFANHISDKVLVSRIYKELLQLKNKKTDNINKKV